MFIWASSSNTFFVSAHFTNKESLLTIEVKDCGRAIVIRCVYFFQDRSALDLGPTVALVRNRRSGAAQRPGVRLRRRPGRVVDLAQFGRAPTGLPHAAHRHAHAARLQFPTLSKGFIKRHHFAKSYYVGRKESRPIL